TSAPRECLHPHKLSVIQIRSAGYMQERHRSIAPKQALSRSRTPKVRRRRHSKTVGYEPTRQFAFSSSLTGRLPEACISSYLCNFSDSKLKRRNVKLCYTPPTIFAVCVRYAAEPWATTAKMARRPRNWHTLFDGFPFGVSPAS